MFVFVPDLVIGAGDLGLDLDLRSTGAESLDLPDGSEDVVVSTLRSARWLIRVGRSSRSGASCDRVDVSCSSSTSPASRAVASPRQQRLMRIPCGLVGERCDLLAETHHLIERAGFARLRSRLDPSRRVAFGSAVR